MSILESINETEIKIMLTQDEYERFFSKSHDIITQSNYYYQLNDCLIVRVRKAENNYFIQYKVDNGNEKLLGLLDKTEYSMRISEADFLIIKNNPDKLYVFLDIEQKTSANLKGFLETRRSSFALESTMPETQIDVNKYNNTVDYELEWEIERAQYPKAVKILKDNGIDINNRISGVSKLGRLIKKS